MDLQNKSEMKRKAVHISNGFWAFSLAFLPRIVAILVVFVALFLTTCVFRPNVYNRAFEAMARPYDYELGILVGPSLYVIVVLIVIFFFDFRIAAFSFAMLAFGDGFATIIGMKYGRHKTRFGKSWEGFLAFTIVGFIFASIAFLFVDYYRNEGKADWAPISEIIITDLPDLQVLLSFFIIITFITGFVELFLGNFIDDNILVPLTTSIGLTLFLV